MVDVDGAIESFQIHASKLFAQAEDAVTGAAGAILMPFIKPADSFIPEGDGLDSEDEEDARQSKTLCMFGKQISTCSRDILRSGWKLSFLAFWLSRCWFSSDHVVLPLRSEQPRRSRQN
jgi:hypothetical protein